MHCKRKPVEEIPRPKKRQRLHEQPPRGFKGQESGILPACSATQNPGVSQVLYMPELLECIFLQLDMQTLLVSAQRTCRTWRELISTSPALQEALFFKPQDGPAGFDGQDGRDQADNTGKLESRNVACQGVRKNPLLASVFPAWFQDYQYKGPSPHRRNGRRPRPGDGENELATLSSVSRLPIWTSYSSQPFAAATEQFLHSPSASWRRMLIQQPPAYRLGYWATLDHMAPGQQASIKHYPSGLHMGQLYDESVEAAAATIGYEIRCLLWGAEGLQHVLREYVGPKEYWKSTNWPHLDFAACAPYDEEAKDKLDTLLMDTDVTILVQQNLFALCMYRARNLEPETAWCCDPTRGPVVLAGRRDFDDKIREFRRIFACGARNLGVVAKGWEDLPKGKTLWEWEKEIDIDNDL
ncbi:hypothetical protein PFICI_02898 [Pestalotiopsis fici W106-1]|uniref:F-box domain-containing protein n=1 Tax=Pestalotiopsis fici (strain W106-1 / CGMCC3.15140) TaxID=1229662 RepID=W3XFJ8_PESFW|nr:uncharacterized protein PFICI_02898 [Pestalotiopsis fici W106-1]ETS84873.1 hypothetical protein PFICI_02898 [Pestalotiopsis fici W106-1]